MASELMALGSAHSKKNVRSIPQLSVDGFFISLSKLQSDPRLIFSRMQYREDYDPLTQSLVG